MMTIASTLGWFSRIVAITVELDGPLVADEGEEFIIPWDSFTGQVALFDCKGNISGRVKISVMDGVRVWHTGLLLNVEQYLHYLDPFVSSDLCAREMKIVVDPVGSSGSEGCWLEGTVYVYFSIPLRKNYDGHDCYAAYTAISNSGHAQQNSQSTDSGQGRRLQSAVPITYFVKDTVTSPLTSGSSRSTGVNSSGSGQSGEKDMPSTSELKDACRWAATYNGEAFGLKHSLMVTLCRPWYAHSPELCVPLKLYATLNETHEDVERDGEALDSYNSPRPLTLSVVDFTGLCMMTIPSRWVDLDDPIVTKITLRDYSSAVLSIHLLLIRTEYIHDAYKDTIIFVHKVFGEAAEELRDIIPPDAMHSSGYVARDDHMGPSTSSAATSSSEPKREEPVRGGDGACATFLLELPMGNAPHLCNCPSRSSSSSMAAASRCEGPGNLPSLTPESAAGLKDRESSSSSSKGREESVGTGLSSSSKSSSYREKVLRAKEGELEIQKRLSYLYPSFDTSQSEGSPFALHIALDSDDEDDSSDEDEEEEEGNEGAVAVDVSQIELQNISLQDPERGEGSRAAGGKGSRSTAAGNHRDEEDIAENYLRSQQIKKLKAAKAELKRSRRSKPYFDFLGDSVSVRYFLRLVVQDSDGECKWNTEEIVLYRSKAPRSSSILSAIVGGAEYDSTAV